MAMKLVDVTQRLRKARWHWLLPAAFFVGICLLPSGTIEASPGDLYHPPVWLAPMGWPLLAMAVLFAAAAFTDKLRARCWQILIIGAAASLILELALVVFGGSAALYSFELGTDLQNRIFVDFQLDILAFGIMPMDILLAATSLLVLWTRHGGQSFAPTARSPPATLPSPPDPIAPEQPGPTIGAPSPGSPPPRSGPAQEAVPPAMVPAPSNPSTGRRAQESGPASQFPKQ